MVITKLSGLQSYPRPSITPTISANVASAAPPEPDDDSSVESESVEEPESSPPQAPKTRRAAARTETSERDERNMKSPWCDVARRL